MKNTRFAFISLFLFLVGIFALENVQASYLDDATNACQAAKAKNKPSYSDDVCHAQFALSKLIGYNPGVIDGLKGGQTTATIKQFQSSNVLPVTGELDERTKQELQVEYDKWLKMQSNNQGPTPIAPRQPAKPAQPSTIKPQPAIRPQPVRGPTRVKYPKTLIYDLFLTEQNGTETPTGFKNTVSIKRGADGKTTAQVIMGQGVNRMQFQSVVDSQNRLIMSSVRDTDGFHTINRTKKAGLIPGVPRYQHKSSGSSGVTNRYLLDNYRPVDLYGLIILSLTKHVNQDYRKSETLKLFVGRSTTLVSLVGKGGSFKARNLDCHQFLVKDQVGIDSLKLTVCTDSDGYIFPTDIQFLKEVFTAGKIHWKLSHLVK